MTSLSRARRALMTSVAGRATVIAAGAGAALAAGLAVTTAAQAQDGAYFDRVATYPVFENLPEGRRPGDRNGGRDRHRHRRRHDADLYRRRGRGDRLRRHHRPGGAAGRGTDHAGRRADLGCGARPGGLCGGQLLRKLRRAFRPRLRLRAGRPVGDRGPATSAASPIRSRSAPTVPSWRSWWRTSATRT